MCGLNRGSADPDPWSSEYVEPLKSDAVLKMEEMKKEQEMFERRYDVGDSIEERRD
jgi:hypothetical protein